jgi:hypothetical protein
MEPFEKDELTDRELDQVLTQWKAPSAPARLRAAVFGEHRAPWWRRFWTVSIRVPLPVACALMVVAVLAIGALLREPRVVVRTERIYTPLPADMRQDGGPGTVSNAAWRPVRELRPRVIRGSDVQ